MLKSRNMRIRLITIGKPRLPFAKDGLAFYLARLRAFHAVDVVHCSDRATPAAVLAAIDRRLCLVADERGTQMRSTQLAAFLERSAVEGRGDCAVVIGGPDGVMPEVRDRADVVWSLGALTFPHDVAMMLVAEALYRAATITAGHPYHRA